jgi:sortase A
MKEPDPIIFVIDDDRMIRDGLQSLIRSVGLRARTFASAHEFLAAKLPDAPACLILDVRMPGLSGLDLQLKLTDASIQIPIIFITGHGDIPMSVRAMKEGAHEFLTKPAVARRKKQDKYGTIRKVLKCVFLVVGLALLAFYAGARIHRSVMSRLSLRQFEELKESASNDTPEHVPAKIEPERTALKPDFVLWSGKRIKAFGDSLKLRLDPPLAILRIPRLNLEAPMLNGTDDITLNRGVGWIEGTAQIGENGNIGIAGHRDGFFRGLKDIKVGDRVDLEGPRRTETYVVDQLRIVTPNDISVLLPRPKPSLTLVTCYPFYFIGRAPSGISFTLLVLIWNYRVTNQPGHTVRLSPNYNQSRHKANSRRFTQPSTPFVGLRLM